MEHLSTFGLSRDPFGCDAQLLWYFEGGAFGAATQKLHRAAMQAKGLCVVTGRGGVGKTMLVRHLLAALEEEVFEASMLVAVPGVTDMRWLLTRWALQLGVETPAADLGAVLAQIYEQLAVVREDGRNAVLIIDEAQVLAERGMLGELRGLLNLEYEEKRLVTIVLVGSPALLEAVSAEPALRERVDLPLQLGPLPLKDVPGYLHHRIRAAGGNPAIFESSAVSAITKACGGLPRRINALADHTLYAAHVAGRVSATAGDVAAAVAELQLGDEAEAPAATTPRGSEESLSARPPAYVNALKRRAPVASLASTAKRDDMEPEIELGDVIAEPTGRRASPLPASTGDLSPFELPGAFEVERGSAADESTELEDLFADIVDE